MMNACFVQQGERSWRDNFLASTSLPGYNRHYSGGVWYRPPNQEDREDETLYRQIGAALCSKALVLKGGFNHHDICWRDDTVGHKPEGSWNMLMTAFFSK